MNHLAILGSEYLELIAAAPGETRRAEILAAPFGLNGLVFGTDNSAAVYAALHEAGVPVEPPLEFSRPVELADGPRDATFRTVRLTPGTVPAGRIYFCHHFTRDLVWRDEWRHHANGAIGVARAVIAARDPSVLGALFARMFGEDAVRRSGSGCSLAVGLSRFDVITMDALAGEFGDAAPAADGRDRIHGCADDPHPLAGARCSRAGGGTDQRRAARGRVASSSRPPKRSASRWNFVREPGQRRRCDGRSRRLWR